MPIQGLTFMNFTLHITKTTSYLKPFYVLRIFILTFTANV